MKIKKIKWKNVASYGNKIQSLELTEKSGLIQVIGENGVGKCLAPDTRIIINVQEDPIFIKKIHRYLPKPLFPIDR